MLSSSPGRYKKIWKLAVLLAPDVLPVQLLAEYSCAPGGSCSPPTTGGGPSVCGVNPKTGFVLKGTVRHHSSSYSGYLSQARRAFSAGDLLYTMSDAKIVMSDLSRSLVQIHEVDFR
jgi:hypothetical protein